MTPSGKDRLAELHRQWFERCLTQRQLNLIDALFTPDHVLRYVAAPAWDPREGQPIVAMAKMYLRACPDLYFTVEEQIVSDDRVVTRFRVLGTQHGRLGVLPASHKPFEVTGIEIVRFAGERIAETWHHIDALGVLVQTGAIQVLVRPEVKPRDDVEAEP